MPRKLDPAEAVERMRKAGAEPQEPYPGSDLPWKCECLTCHELGYPRLSSLGGRRGQGPCKPCGRLQANAKTRKNEAEAIAVMKAKGLEPLVDYPGAGKPWKSRCNTCAGEVSPTYGTVRTAKTGCKHCASHLRGEKQRGLTFEQRGKQDADLAAFIAEMNAAGMQPLDEFPGAKKGWRSQCMVCGTIGSPTLGAIRGGQGGCVPCGQAKVAEAAKLRSLDPVSAAQEMMDAGLTPLEPYPGSIKPWRCTCQSCQREVSPSLASIRRGSGCRYCASHGIDLTGPTLVYVIAHPKWGATKVGIGACTGYNSRLLQHTKQGWTVFRTWEVVTGALALDIEQSVLDQLSAKNLTKYLSPKQMRNGWTETCDATKVSVARLTRMVQSALRSINTPGAESLGPRRRLSANGLIDPVEAEAQMMAAGWQPLEPYPGGTNIGWPSRCLACEAESQPRLNSVRNQDSGCAKCKAKTSGVLKAAAHAATAVEIMHKAGYEPLDPYVNSATPWLSRCITCEEESMPRLSNVKQGSRCRNCRKGRQHRGPTLLLTKREIDKAHKLYKTTNADGKQTTLGAVATKYNVSTAAMSRYFRMFY